MGSGLAAGVGALQGLAEVGTGIKSDLMQLLGLLRLDTGIPKYQEQIRELGRQYYGHGKQTWEPYIRQSTARVADAVNWEDPNYRGGPEFRRIGEHYRESSNVIRQGYADARHRSNIAMQTAQDSLTKAAAMTDFTKGRVKFSEEQFSADRQEALDSLQKNVARDVQAVVEGNLNNAREAITQGVDALVASGFENDPLMRAELERKVKDKSAQNIGVERGKRMADFERTNAELHASLTSTRAQLMAANTGLINQAHDIETRTRDNALNSMTDIINTMGNLGVVTGKALWETFNQASDLSLKTAEFMNLVDRDNAAINYGLLTARADAELQAIQLGISGLVGGVPILTGWTSMVPNFVGIYQGVRGGGGGGGGGGGFSPSIGANINV